MGILTEVPNLRQFPDEPRRRWFTSDDLDLIVWLGDSGHPIAFQLSYDKGLSECVLTWRSERGFSNMTVDDGESVGGRYKPVPILVADRPFPAKRVSERFAEASIRLPTELAGFVKRKLQEHPSCKH